MSLFTHYSYRTHLSHMSQYDTYLAYSGDNPEQRVILTLFDAQYVLPTVTYEDFQRMEKRLQGLKHPHIVAMLELGREQGRPYLVSEYQEDGSLRQHLDQRSSGHLSLNDAVAIVMQVGQAAAFAHTHGVVHQDIRPENILLHNQSHALLTNFSLGDLLREPDRSDRRAVSYLSPEQTIGIVSPASDQYALGCLLYELVTGEVPNLVSIQQHSPLVPMLPRTLEMVILRAMALKPEERYPSIPLFLAELKLATQPEPAIFPRTMESGNVPAIHQALATQAPITSLDTFSQYEPTEHVAEGLPPEYLVVETEGHAAANKEDQNAEQLVVHALQEAPGSTQTKEQRTVIIRAPVRKRTAGVISVGVTLLAIALLLAYAFNSGRQSEVKHDSTLAVSTAGSNTMTVPSTPIPTTAKPGATQKPTARTSQHTPAPGTSSNLILTATPKPPGIGSIRIDSGGTGSGSFVGDEDFSDSTPNRPSRASNDSSSVIDTSRIRDPAPESVYQSARIGDCLYTIAHLTPHASYTVRLHFAETYWTQPGERTFDVFLNARLILHNFDIFATAGGENKAVIEQFVVPADNTGTITVQFQTVKNNAQINAIEVLAV